jgi:hypothetical protein
LRAPIRSFDDGVGDDKCIVDELFDGKVSTIISRRSFSTWMVFSFGFIGRWVVRLAQKSTNVLERHLCVVSLQSEEWDASRRRTCRTLRRGVARGEEMAVMILGENATHVLEKCP